MTPKEALKKYFGYSDFRPSQLEIINHILNNKNVLAVLPTGAGKSLCYQIPALISDNYSIVISPLIALMKDQVDLLNKEKLIASFINSSLDFRQTQKVLSDITNNKIKLLYVSPERLSNISFIEHINETPPAYVFVDEAHCISEWGHNFRPSYRKINEFLRNLNIKKLSAFTATATPEVRSDILQQLSIQDAEVIVRGFERDNLSLEVLRTRQKKERAYSYIKKYGTPAIVYTTTRKQAEEIDEYLRHKGIKSAYYHAGLASGVRSIIQDDFINDRINVITATNAFGMGIDKKDVRLIIHYSMPSSLENYYQEIGRAGRDGNESKIVLFFEERDKDLQEYLINSSYPGLTTLRIVYNSLYDYAKVAVGLKPDAPVELNENFYILLKKNRISETLFNSSLRALENNGYIETLSDFDRSHFFRFLLETQKLQAYVKQIANNPLKNTIISLLKIYGSNSFSRRVKIDFNKLIEITDLKRYELQDNLLSLSSIGIIEYEKPASNVKILLKEARVAVNNIQFDEQSEKLHKNALSKVDKIAEYINSKKCRFKFILEYFGEDVPEYRCGKCDNCTGISSIDAETFEYLEEILINTIHEASNKISERDLLNLLIGHSSSGRLTSYSNFGTCTHFKKDELKNSLLSLVNKGFVIKVDRYLSLAENCLDNLSESIPVEEEIQPEKSENNYSIELFHKLMKVRSDIARKFSQPPEIICNDSLLRLIAEKKPETQTELLNLEGMNKRIFNKIGDNIIDEIKEFLRKEDLHNNNYTDIKQNLATIKKLVNKGYSLDEISGLLKLSDHLVSLQVESLLTYEPDTDINKLIPQRDIDIISEKIDEGITDLKLLKSELKDITYAKLRIVLTKKKLS